MRIVHTGFKSTAPDFRLTIQWIVVTSMTSDKVQWIIIDNLKQAKTYVSCEGITINANDKKGTLPDQRQLLHGFGTQLYDFVSYMIDVSTTIIPQIQAKFATYCPEYLIENGCAICKALRTTVG